MSFVEIIFLPFLAASFFLFSLFRDRPFGQFIVLLLASFVFYAWWNSACFGLLLGSILFNFMIGRLLGAAADRRRKILLLTGLIGDLALLGYFKYANFFIANINQLWSSLGMRPALAALNVVLPIGISFYTFQLMSYLLDVYAGRIAPARSLLKFSVLASFFGHLIAGPIFRFKDMLPQMEGNLFSRSNDAGLFYIAYGISKKLLLADPLGYRFADPVFASPGAYGSLDLLLGVYAYAFQIFFDFSAYSDIAIGLGKIFGLDFPVNFRSPYLAANPREFWQRWHITLSSWLRDYLYIPLGGNRVSEPRILRNILIVMLLGGAWHGAKWTFIVWGGLHGLYLIVHRFVVLRSRLKDWSVPSGWRVFGFFQLVCLAWIFFRSQSLGAAGEYLLGLFSARAGSQSLNAPSILVMLAAAFFVHTFLEPRLPRLAERFQRFPWAVQGGSVYLLLVVLALLTEQAVARQAFIYFQF